MKKLTFTLLLAVFFNLQGVISQTDLTGAIPINPDVKTGTLSNGLKYYIRYNNKPENKVELRLAVNAGAILEDESQLGLAHFMEHMNFNGLKHFPKNELVHYLQSIGVAFGNDLNAYTGFDETVYILPVPSDNQGKLDSAFMVLADWSGASLLTPEEIDKERGVILAESRLGKGANDRMMKIWLPEMFNGSKYAVRLPIGNDSIIENFDHAVLIKFNDDWYRPNLQAVIVVGDMPVDEAEKLIVEKFSHFENPKDSPERQETFPISPYETNKAMVVSDNEANRTSISIYGSSHPRKPMTTLADYRNKLIEELCFSMLRARLTELSVSANPPFIGAYAYLGGGWARGYESYMAGARCGSSEIEKAVVALVTESMRVKEFGFTEDELTRAKAAMLSEYEKQYNERDKTESERLTNELVSNFFEKDAIPGIEWEYDFVKNNINQVMLNDFDKVRRQIDIDKSFFALVTSKTQADLPSNDQVKGWIESALKNHVEAYTENKIASTLLAKEPLAGKIIKTEKNEKLGTTTYTLNNQVTVCIRPTDFKNDEILIKGSRFGGFSLYKGDDYQSAQWCSNLQKDMGYGNFTNPDLTKFLSGKIAAINTTIADYTESVDGKCSVKDMETMFQLLYLKCTSPRKDEAAFQSFVTRSKQQLELLKQNPQYLFIDSAYNTFYQGNKRAHLIQNATDYDKINIDHALAYYTERIGNPYGMYYTIVGSFTEEQIVPLIEKYIGGMVSADINVQYNDIGLFPLAGSDSFTLHKGTEQQAMLMHYINGKMPFNADDNFMLEQLNAVLNNKVIDTIREKMSAIYGGGCGGSLQKYPREEFLIQSYFPCSPDNIEKVHTAFIGLIESTKINGGITDYDWQQAREPAIEKNEVDLKLNEYWLNALQTSFIYGTDPERILTKDQRLKEIKPEQLIATARKFYGNPNIFKAEWLPEAAK
ncbi:MAG: insulinase family protein [Bacteroidales bacterium]|nr:insulinase family protein [Bacteroidales bacterium]